MLNGGITSGSHRRPYLYRMNKQCLSAYRAGATTMLDEVLQYLPGPQLRALREWVEQDLANAKGGEPPLPPSLWRNEQAGAD